MPVSHNPLRRAFDALRGGRLVRHSIPNLLHDLRYGAPLGGSVDSRFRELGQHRVESTDWHDLRSMFAHPLARPTPEDVIVDVGCGKGRALAFFHELTGGRNRIVGLELDPDVAAATRKRFAGRSRIEVLTGDALELLPSEGTLVYLANPFDEPVVRRFAERLLRGDLWLERLRVIYFNPAYEDVFRDAGFTAQPLVSSMGATLLLPPSRA